MHNCLSLSFPINASSSSVGVVVFFLKLSYNTKPNPVRIRMAPRSPATNFYNINKMACRGKKIG